MTPISKICLLLTSVLLAACGDNTKKIDIITKPGQVQITQPDMPKPIKLYDVTFRVITAENLNQFIAEQKTKNNSGNYTFIAIGIKDYENLAINLEELKRYIDQQKAVIIYYKTMTTIPETNPSK
jgi:hypothetical protein